MPTRTHPCESIRSLHEFQVAGSGTFPLDMLRYDSCWPAKEASDVVEISLSLNPRVASEQRTVVLVGLRAPTEERWRSFGWEVV